VYVTGRRKQVLDEVIVSVGPSAIGVVADVSRLDDDLERVYSANVSMRSPARSSEVTISPRLCCHPWVTTCTR
jgi:hypothetical protein